MFDNTKPNVIILTDCTDTVIMTKHVGPYKVAAALRNAGFEAAVIHHLHIFTYEEVKKILSTLISSKTLYVGFNSVFYQNISQKKSDESGTTYGPKEIGAMLPHGIQFNKDIIEFIKLLNPNCKLVIGGPDATDDAKLKDYEYVVTGYADNSVVNIARHLHDGSPLEKSYRSIHGFTIVNDSVAQDYDFVGTVMKYESHDCILPGEVLPIEIARGCIFKCAFCSYPLNGKKKLDFIKHEEILKQEFIDNWEKFGTTTYTFADDTFNDSEEKVNMIYRISKSLPFELKYWAYIRLDLLSAHIHLVDKLYESGLRGFFFGIETLNQRTASAIGKGGSREKLIETLRYIKSKYGNDVMLHASFILGLPYESLESMNQTIEFLFSEKSPLDSTWVYALRIPISKTSGFDSELTINYEKYGYKKLGIKGPYMDWENEVLSYSQALEMEQVIRNRILNDKQRQKVGGFISFMISGLGINLQEMTNISMKDIDWNKIENIKNNRALEYKQKISEEFNIIFK